MQKAIQKQRWWIVHKYNLHDSSQRYCKRSGLAFGDFKSRRQTVLAVHGTWSCCCSWLLTFVYRHFFRPVSSVDWTVNFECNCHSCGFFGTMGWKRNRAIRVMHCGQCSEHHCCHVKVTESCSLHRHMCCRQSLVIHLGLLTSVLGSYAAIYVVMCIFYWIHWLLNGLLSPLHFCRCRIFSDLCLKVLTEATLVWSFFQVVWTHSDTVWFFLFFLDSCSSLAVSPFLFSFSFHFVLTSPLWCKVKKVSLEPFFHLAYPSKRKAQFYAIQPCCVSIICWNFTTNWSLVDIPPIFQFGDICRWNLFAFVSSVSELLLRWSSGIRVVIMVSDDDIELSGPCMALCIWWYWWSIECRDLNFESLYAAMCQVQRCMTCLFFHPMDVQTKVFFGGFFWGGQSIINPKVTNY